MFLLTYDLDGDALNEWAVTGLAVGQTLVDRPLTLPPQVGDRHHRHHGLGLAGLEAEGLRAGVEGDLVPCPGQDGQRMS